MSLQKGRFDHCSGEESNALLRVLEGPLLELWLAWKSDDASVADVIDQLMPLFQLDPQFAPFFPTEEELESWKRFEREPGGEVEAIGEFVYGPHENPWRCVAVT
jgi:hypothetical protein